MSMKHAPSGENPLQSILNNLNHLSIGGDPLNKLITAYAIDLSLAEQKLDAWWKRFEGLKWDSNPMFTSKQNSQKYFKKPILINYFGHVKTHFFLSQEIFKNFYQ